MTTQWTMTVDETAVVLRVNRQAAYAAVKRGQIPSIRIGKRILVPRAALERMLEGAGVPQQKSEVAG
jgi:excisionase family DNA binding protein